MSDQKIKISLIDVPTDRLRDVDPDWAACLAGMFTETGHKTPIDVEADGTRFKLVAGAHRLAAAKILKWKEIDARVLEPQGEHGAHEMRLHEILENLGRKDFNALERCEALFELKRVYEALHPQTKNGGDRKSQATKNKKENQMAIFAFCFSAAETTGLSDRSVRLSVQIFEGLSQETRERLKGTAFATKQSDLKTLAELDHQDQAKVLDLVLGEYPKAASIADARLLMSGKPAPKEAEVLLGRVSNILPKLPRASRLAIFRQHKKDIIALVKKEGWLDA